MNIYWYWPFARPEELGLATAQRWQDDSITVSVIDREAAPVPESGARLTVVRELPDVRSTARLSWIPSRAFTYWSRWNIRRRRERGAYDLVHHHYPNRFTDVIGRPSAPWVLSVHDALPHQRRLPAIVERSLLARLYRRPDAIVVHHRWLADRLTSEFRVDPHRIHVVPHQVFPVPLGSETMPSSGPPLVLFFGSLRPNKGVATLIDAMAHPNASGLRFVVAGRGDAQIEDLVRRAADRLSNLEAEIGYIPLERKRELFRAASVVVLPYTAFESQSGVLHDAYGHGRPVVVTDVGALGDTVTSDGTGVVVAGHAAGLLDGIEDALANWTTYAAAARRVAAERTPDESARRLRELYVSLCDELAASDIPNQTSMRKAIGTAFSDPRRVPRLAQSAVTHRIVGPLTARSRPGGVAVFHIGRCGSTVLSELLEQHPRIYWDGETYVRVFEQLKHAGIDRSDANFSPSDYVQARLSRSGRRWFGFDVKFVHITEFGVSIEQYLSDLEQMGITRIVSLQRQNYLRKAVSTINGGRRSSHHHRAGRRSTLDPLVINCDDVFLDVHRGSLLEHFERYDTWYENLRRTVPSELLLELTYEADIERDPREAASRVVEFLDLPAADMDVTLMRMNPEPLEELVANLDEVRAYLADTPFAWMAT